jgi:type 1 glutamine amidotransferase
MRQRLTLLSMALFACCSSVFADDKQWVTYAAAPDFPGAGRHIVLVGGDEEYRSEESLPMLGKLLSSPPHGFKCTVLFAIDPKTGQINPEVTDNIPGLQALDTADLMIIATRFRNLPDDQMKHVVDYLKRGKPVIGLRTATHAFKLPPDSTYAKYSWDYAGKDFEKGFGKQILGETWVAHHGKHKVQSTRGVFAPDARAHPILRGIKNGDIWGNTDVYAVTLPLPGDSKPLVLGQVLEGMNKTDKPVEGPQNNPMMPVAWVKTYKSESGRTGRVFTTTMGSATDLATPGTRRMVVNAVYWAADTDWQIPPDGSEVKIEGEYNPTMYGFGGYVKGKKPSDYAPKKD